MKKLSATMILALMVGLSSLIATETVNIGDSETDVRNKMGKPAGTITIGKNEKILSYPQGDITLKDGKVSRIEFLPGGKTYTDLNKSSAEKLKQRVEFDKKLFNQPLEKFTESEEYKGLTDSEKIVKLKEFKDQNPTVDISKMVEELEKKVAENKTKNPDSAKQAEPSNPTPPPSAPPASPVPAKPTEPTYQGAANPYQGSAMPSYPSAGSSGGYNLQQSGFYDIPPKNEEKK